MANLIPVAQWDPVYQLEKEPAIGGAGGVMNRQAQALTNRTELLKTQIEAINARLDQLPGADAVILNWLAPL